MPAESEYRLGLKQNILQLISQPSSKRGGR